MKKNQILNAEMACKIIELKKTEKFEYSWYVNQLRTP